MIPAMQGFQTLGQNFGQENPLAQALMAYGQQMHGPQQTTPPPQPASAGPGLMDRMAQASDKADMIGDYVDGGGIASVLGQVMDTYVNKKAAGIAERGAQTKQEERLLRAKGYGEARRTGGV